MHATLPARAPKSQLAAEQPLTGECWNPPKKDTPHPKAKKKLQWDSKQCEITIKSNPLPTRQVTHRLENNKIKEVLLLWRFWTLHQASHPEELAKGLGIPRESDLEAQQDLIRGLPQYWGKQTLALEGTNKILCTLRHRGKEQWPHRRLNQNHLLVLEGLLWRCGSAGAHHRASSSSPGRSPLA